MTGRSPAVKERWSFLAKCLRLPSSPGSRSPSSGCTQSSPLFGSSMRRFHSFDLFERDIWPERRTAKEEDEEEDEEEEEEEWDFVTYAADCPLSGERLRMDLRLHRQLPSLSELRAFNNTGNVCVWPSEECLAWFLLEQGRPRPGFGDVRSVLELGSGQAGLAGLVCALYWPAVELVLLTDGNERCVANLAQVLTLNCGRFAAREVGSTLFRWGDSQSSPGLSAQFDLILCADCFFFEEGHSALLETVWRLLEPRRGRCLCVAPERSGSFERFRQRAARRFPCARRIEPFSGRLQERHEELETHAGDYTADLHLPKMLMLSRSAEPALSSPTDLQNIF